MTEQHNNPAEPLDQTNEYDALIDRCLDASEQLGIYWLNILATPELLV